MKRLLLIFAFLTLFISGFAQTIFHPGHGEITVTEYLKLSDWESDGEFFRMQVDTVFQLFPIGWRPISTFKIKRDTLFMTRPMVGEIYMLVDPVSPDEVFMVRPNIRDRVERDFTWIRVSKDSNRLPTGFGDPFMWSFKLGKDVGGTWVYLSTKEHPAHYFGNYDLEQNFWTIAEINGEKVTYHFLAQYQGFYGMIETNYPNK